MSDYVLREAVASDKVYVLRAWSDSYRPSHSSGLLSLSALHGTCENCGHSVPYDYAAVMKVTLANILARDGLRIWVAKNPRAAPPNDVHGFIVVEKDANIPKYEPPDYTLRIEHSLDPLVHFIYVKKLYRNLGMARALFKAADVDPRGRFLYSCTTASSVSCDRAGKIPLGVWAPMSARFSKETSKIHDQEHPRSAIRPSGAAPAAK